MAQSKNLSDKMPVIFIGHGSPMNAVADNAYTQALKALGPQLPRPRAILVISAHWVTANTQLTAMDTPKTIHDFFGFPQQLFNIHYAAPGDPALAEKISTQIAIPQIQLDTTEWGLDHGAWAVLRHLYPHADIPVLQLSMDLSQPFTFHYELGQKLRFLRDDGVLILGSGNLVHNLQKIDWNTDTMPFAWAKQFDAWLITKLEARDFSALIDAPVLNETFDLGHPTVEHYVPLLYVLGASDENDQLIFDYEGFQNASMSMRCLRFA